MTVVGDLDDDGYAELAIGASNAAVEDKLSRGKVYLMPGSSAGGTAALSGLDPGMSPRRIVWGDSGGWVALDTICKPKTPNVIVPCQPGYARPASFLWHWRPSRSRTCSARSSPRRSTPTAVASPTCCSVD